MESSFAASHFQILHTFQGKQQYGQFPGNLIIDSAGNLYGVSPYNGLNACTDGCGTIFELSPGISGWKYKDLYNFKGPKHSDGAQPSGIVMDAQGNLYGTTAAGGAYDQGTVFELSPDSSGIWTETLIYNLIGQPEAAPVFGPAGTLYGTTVSGGGNGTAFQLTRNSDGNWSENVIWTFGGSYGRSPTVVTLDQAGNLYMGVGFSAELSPVEGSWKETILNTCGDNQISSVIFDGTSLYGGDYEGGKFGYGAIDEISPAGNGTWNCTDIWDFNPAKGDGAFISAPLTAAPNGDLYGATIAGGNGFSEQDCLEFNPCGYGTVFRMSRNSAGVWAETAQYRFTTGVDFGGPTTALVLDSTGKIYGTAVKNATEAFIFEITP